MAIPGNPGRGDSAREPFLRKWTDGKRSVPLLFVSIALLVFVLFLPVGDHGLITLDDGDYIGVNPMVRDGLTWQGVIQAFGTMRASNWHPMTWLSHMADVSLFGFSYGDHHLVSAGLHALNSALLFLILHAMTGSPWRSAVAALLFGVHPLHVQSVAWFSERKDVLSTLFAFLAIGRYAEYARTGSRTRYGMAVLFFALGLMSKPMVVTLPFVLLLLDYWPLGRLSFPGSLSGEAGEGPTPPASPVPLRRLLWEKVPFLVLAAASSVVTFIAQQTEVAMIEVSTYPMRLRLANGVLSYVIYLRQTVWPSSLAVIYPLTIDNISAASVTGSVLLLLGATAGVLAMGRRRPHLAVGWFWFLGTLVPVIGLVQVGAQLHADRYMYLPSVGLFAALAWSIPDASAVRPIRGKALAAVVLAVLAALSAATRHELSFWRHGVTLYRRAMEVTEGNFLAREYYGTACYREGAERLNEGKTLEAIPWLEEAVQARPGHPQFLYGLGLARLRSGRTPQAAESLREVLRITHEGDPLREKALQILSSIGGG